MPAVYTQSLRSDPADTHKTERNVSEIHL